MPKYVLRFTDGPLADTGTLITDVFTWPLPDQIAFGGFAPEGPLVQVWDEANQSIFKQLNVEPECIYTKSIESQLPDDVDGHPNVLRGAQYQLAVSDAAT